MVPLSLICCILPYVAASNALGHQSNELIRILGPQGVNLARLAPTLDSLYEEDYAAEQAVLSDVNEGVTYGFRAEWFQQPLDHFSNDSSHKWHQRFWVNSRYYKPGKNAPVIVIDGGETSGEVRMF